MWTNYNILIIKKGGIKVHTIIHVNEDVPSDIRFTSAAITSFISGDKIKGQFLLDSDLTNTFQTHHSR